MNKPPKETISQEEFDFCKRRLTPPNYNIKTKIPSMEETIDNAIKLAKMKNEK